MAHWSGTRADSFVQNLAIKRDALDQRLVLSGLLAVEFERNSQAELHPGESLLIPDTFLLLNKRADLPDEGFELIGDIRSGLPEGEFGQPGLDKQAQNLLQVAPELWRQRNGLGWKLIFSACFGAGNAPRARPIEPHSAGAFAAQSYDAAPDQNIGAGLLEQVLRFIFGVFLGRLFGVDRAVDR